MPDDSGDQGKARPGSRSLAICGAAVVLWWAVPLRWPRGLYAGCYSIVDLEIGLVAALAWLGGWAVSQAPPPRRRPLALRVSAAFLAVLLTAAACDLTYVVWTARVRTFWYYGQSFSSLSHESDPELVWKFRPGFAYHGKSNPFSHEVDFRTDEHGFRNPFGIHQADLVFVGDSVTMAAEVGEEATFARRTAQALGVGGVNLGFFGYGPQQELVVLKRYGLAYQPRAVVWQVTEWNDCEDAERYARRAHPVKPQTRPWLEVYETYSPIARRLAKLFRHREPAGKYQLVTFQKSDGFVDSRRLWPHEDNAETCPGGREELERAIAEAHAVCRERGIAFVVLFVPSHTRVLAPYVLPRSIAERDRYRPPGFEGPSRMTRSLAALCQKLECPLIDLRDPLRRRAETDNRRIYIKHDPHLDLDGHDEAARQLVGCLAAMKSLALTPNRAERR